MRLDLEPTARRREFDEERNRTPIVEVAAELLAERGRPATFAEWVASELPNPVAAHPSG